jgi:hypothetical protein
MSMTDDDEFANNQYERRDAGSYVVVGELRIDGKLQTRRIPRANPAYGIAKLEQELEALAQVRAEAEAADAKRARRKTKLNTGDG